MDIDFKKYIIEEIKNNTKEELITSIDNSLDSDNMLFGLGVLFELAWSNSTKDERYNILNNIKKGITD